MEIKMKEVTVFLNKDKSSIGKIWVASFLKMNDVENSIRFFFGENWYDAEYSAWA